MLPATQLFASPLRYDDKWNAKPYLAEKWTLAPDGKTLASGSEDKTIKLWDVAQQLELQTLEGHNGYVYTVAFSQDGKRLASGSYDKTIRLWDVATGSALQTLSGHEAAVYSVAWSADNSTLASGTIPGPTSSAKSTLAAITGSARPA